MGTTWEEGPGTLGEEKDPPALNPKQMFLRPVRHTSSAVVQGGRSRQRSSEAPIVGLSFPTFGGVPTTLSLFGALPKA
jgi:hypothetical protein